MADPIIAEDLVTTRIFEIREQRVMLDFHLAELYGVKTKVLKQAVRRNLERFPDDFMFELSRNEFDNLRSQVVTSNTGGHRYMPMAFTEHGVLMLSSVLRSESAIQMNIQIMRIFVRMRNALMEKGELLLKIEQIERRLIDQDSQIKVLFDHLKQFIIDKTPRRPIGFRKGRETK